MHQLQRFATSTPSPSSHQLTRRRGVTSVIDQFPGTPYAETAKKELKDLN